MALVVYVLCSAMSLICAILLLRSFRQTGARLLLWSGLCFAGLALNNALLVLDLGVLPDRDLALLRLLPAVMGVAILVFGLIWESR